MKTKQTPARYLPFVVKAEKGEGETISDPSKWCEGVAMKTFYGRIREELIDKEAENPAEDMNIFQAVSEHQVYEANYS